jgi:DNA ligase 1
VKRFSALYEAVDRTTSTNEKVKALQSYFAEAPAEDAAWALFFLTGRKIKRLIPSRVLWELTREITTLPEWLLEHCYAAVGDFAECMALLVEGTAAGTGHALPLHVWVEERILPLKQLDARAQRAAVSAWWCELDAHQAFVLNKIVTGEFRVGASATLVARALAQAAGVAPAEMAHRLMGDWPPTAAFLRSVLARESSAAVVSQPYPFFLASPLDAEPASLGPREEWLAEWKWDGIRAQLVRRGGAVFLWSRGEELVTDRFPEISTAARALPEGTVLDGEVLAYREGVLPFALLQTRIGRQKLTPRTLAAAPAAFMAYDLLEDAGLDVREEPLVQRRSRLQVRLTGAPSVFQLSPPVEGTTWDDLARLRQEARARHVEGLMLKRLASPYRAGRRRGDWWKWKIDPFTVDAVLLYARPGNGRRATLLTDYTFGVWDGDELVPVAKAYSGLSDAEIQEMDAWIRRHTREKFGPVRAVEPVQVFELGFEGIAASKRHRSGVAVRFPRMLRWRRDKPAKEADTLQSLQALIAPSSR